MLEGHIYISEKLRDLRGDEAFGRAQSRPIHDARRSGDDSPRRSGGLRSIVAHLRRVVARPAAPAS